MPYTIRKTKGPKPWCLYNKETGEKEGCSETYEKAVAHMRLRYGIDEGWEPTGKKKT